MKIVVDQMPDNPSGCPYSIYSDAKSFEWYSCSKNSICCEIGKPGWQCPIYVGISEALEAIANRITIKKGDTIWYLDTDSGEIEEGIVFSTHYKNGALDSFLLTSKTAETLTSFMEIRLASVSLQAWSLHRQRGLPRA